MKRRMSARQALALVRSHARRNELSVVEMVGRGKGSHRICLLVDREGSEVGRITITDRPGGLSWAVIRDVEQRLAHLFGAMWTEKGR